jgi:hypothetical protein
VPGGAGTETSPAGSISARPERSARRRHHAADRGLVPRHHAAAAREAGGKRIDYRRTGSQEGQSHDRDGGRAAALAHLVRQGQKCPPSIASARSCIPTRVSAVIEPEARHPENCDVRYTRSANTSVARAPAWSTTPLDTAPVCASGLRRRRARRISSSIAR